MLISSVLNYRMKNSYKLTISFFSYIDGCSVTAASGSVISHLWYRISHVEDPKALKSKICV